MCIAYVLFYVNAEMSLYQDITSYIKSYISPKADASSINDDEEINVHVEFDNAKTSVKLKKNNKLNDVRIKLEGNNIIKMNNCMNFTENDALIDIDDEKNFTLREI